MSEKSDTPVTPHDGVVLTAEQRADRVLVSCRHPVESDCPGDNRCEFVGRVRREVAREIRFAIGDVAQLVEAVVKEHFDTVRRCGSCGQDHYRRNRMDRAELNTIVAKIRERARGEA